MEAPELVEVEIEAVRESPSGKRFVLLRAKDDGRVLPIWIGSSEADAIKLAMEGQQPPRPMMHDLALRLLEPLGVQLQRVVVNKLVESTFYGEITLAQGERVYDVDARPSDALALAARTSAPIYAARAVLEAAGAPNDGNWLEWELPERTPGQESTTPSEAPSAEQQPSAE